MGLDAGGARFSETLTRLMNRSHAQDEDQDWGRQADHPDPMSTVCGVAVTGVDQERVCVYLHVTSLCSNETCQQFLEVICLVSQSFSNLYESQSFRC